MRHSVLSLLAILVPFCAVGAQARDASKLVGRWWGSGTFFNADLQKTVDSLPFMLEIEPHRAGSGQVGAASLQDVRVKPTRDYIEVSAKLSRPVAADPALAKDRLVLVVTALNDSTAEAEFHLKSNFIYDLKMREGRVVLTRIP